MNKVVMAYCGGFNTSLCLHWLRYHKGLSVIAFLADLGQGIDLEKVGEKAIELGAQSVHYVDLKETYANNYILPSFRSSARAESGYFLSTALSRPLLIHEVVKLAIDEGCHYISHGATQYSNDHIRFEIGVAALAPHLQVIAPNREWLMETPEEKIRYARRHHMALPSEDSKYEEEINLWGRRLEGGQLLLPEQEAPQDYYKWTRPLEKASTRPVELEIHFKQGIPHRINHKEMRFSKIIRFLNRLGGRHCIGRFETFETKLLGYKSREISEAPAATILYLCHRALEELVLPQETLQFQALASKKYAEIIYRGLWFGELRCALDAFFQQTQLRITGSVRLQLYRGNCLILGRNSEYALYPSPLPLSPHSVDIFKSSSLAETLQRDSY